jgi:hypothetical protein
MRDKAMTLDEIAKDVAKQSKLSHIDDFGCLYDDDWNLSEAEWELVCDKAEALLPTIVITRAERIEHEKAMSGYSAAAWAQSRAESGYSE